MKTFPFVFSVPVSSQIKKILVSFISMNLNLLKVAFITLPGFCLLEIFLDLLSVHGEGKLINSFSLCPPSIGGHWAAFTSRGRSSSGAVMSLCLDHNPAFPHHFHHLPRTQEDTFFNVPFKTLKTLQWLSIRKGMRNKYRNPTNSLRLGSL